MRAIILAGCGVVLIALDGLLMYSGRDGSLTPIGWVGVGLILLAVVVGLFGMVRRSRADAPRRP